MACAASQWFGNLLKLKLAFIRGAPCCAAFVIEKAIHLHGGMGFTWEVPLHYALREVRKLDAAFGAGALSKELVVRLLRLRKSWKMAGTVLNQGPVVTDFSGVIVETALQMAI